MMTENKRINFNHFKKLLSCQPFFVWHDLSFLDFDFNTEDEISFEIEGFVSIDDTKSQLSEIQAKAFGLINEKLFNYLSTKYNNLETIPFKTLEERELLTSKFLKENKVLFNPVFVYEFKGHKVVAQPTLYDPVNKEVIFSKISTGTKRIDLLKMFFDVSIMRKLNIKVEKVGLYILATKYYKKHEVNFFKTTKINKSKISHSFKDKENPLYYEKSQILKAGLEEKKGIDILETINQGFFQETKNKTFYFQDLDYYLEQIINAKDEDDLCPLSEEDNQIWASNKEWKKIVKSKNAWYFHDINGNIVRKKEIIENTPLEQLLKKHSIVKDFFNLDKPKILSDNRVFKKLMSKVDDFKNTKVVWYDFEAFSLPIAPADGFLPFSQVIFQVSIIKTNKMIDEQVNNIVLDPSDIQAKDFVYLIDNIYDEQASYYVVYNKVYELTRLKEMILFLKSINYPNWEETQKKVKEIKEKTFDLLDFFKLNKPFNRPYILIPELRGMFSIKLLEKYVTNNKIDLPYKIKEYKNLNIFNGLKAMETGNDRALKILGDLAWAEKSKDLKEYCENDVRAMIQVYYLILYLLKNK